MKIDRLLGMVIYLLNRETVCARELAERFEVSPRTIQRDMETLGLAGIPVASVQGMNGGYSIIDSFKMDRHLLSSKDFLLILTALEGLCSAYESNYLEATLEKMAALSPWADKPRQGIHLDFGVLREGFRLKNYLGILETAIDREKAVEFEYTDAEKCTSHRLVEPVAVTYKWYAWYIVGFCLERKDYRLFRLTRIRDLRETEQAWSVDHGDVEAILATQLDKREYLNVKLLCPAEERVLLEEAFPNGHIQEEGNQHFVMEFSVPENEKGWLGSLLAFGGRVTVLEPDKLKRVLLEHAREILEKYS